MTKPKIASDWMAGCAGCHMSLLDMDERIIKIAELADLRATPITDLKEPDESGVDVGMLEGGINNTANEEVAHRMRERSKILVALGDCAVFGGVPAMRNFCGIQEALQRAYVEAESIDESGKIPSDPELATMTKVRALQRSGAGGSIRARLPARRRCDLLCVERTGAGPHAGTERRVAALALDRSGAFRMTRASLASVIEIRVALRRSENNMTQKITIEPVTRIEGHAKVTIRMKDDGSVDHAYLHINEFRGFEKFCEGRLYFEMPSDHAAHLRHLPGEPSPGRGQSRRRSDGLPAAASRHPAARIDAHGADHPEPRHALLRTGRPRSAAGLRRRSGLSRNVVGLIGANPALTLKAVQPAQVRAGDHQDAGRPPLASGLCRAGRRQQIAEGRRARLHPERAWPTPSRRRRPASRS